ncbi:NUDIX domain-containing protein [Bacillus sp. MUM 13]|uniref:NUDIX domain-containing protein n=1 Tax=Bacillus sp. MUM 13 TaxID=1678001 RepID=UPI0008F5E0E9|nr:NUDIX domain-containing protein [Bacillus sp. MUM 13]OIK06809.1 phosphohydrolase [Bacillus sp. MUM 13]
MFVNVRAIITRQTPEGREIIIQKRDKPYEGSIPYELPGGQVEEYESLYDALVREVKEETGLEVTLIKGQEDRIITKEENSAVEAVTPFCVYQTLHGPVDSMGAYFLCEVKGEILSDGDATKEVQWIKVEELRRRLEKGVIQFSWVDNSGITYYLRSLELNEDATD